MTISVVENTHSSSRICPKDNPKKGHNPSAPAYETDYIDKYLLPTTRMLIPLMLTQSQSNNTKQKTTHRRQVTQTITTKSVDTSIHHRPL